MGQYYKVVQPETKEYVSSWSLDSGSKLMEHSWMKNPFVKFVESLIAEGGRWFGKPIVWAGDYADTELNNEGNKIYITDENEQYEANLYLLCKTEITPEATKFKHYRYLVNETDKTFVDKNKVVRNDGWAIHPLPLLTSQGNGRGGGDFYGEDKQGLIGTWARKVITVSTKKPKGYKEIYFDLEEIY